MFVAMILISLIALAALFVAYLILPQDIAGLGLDTVGNLLSAVLGCYVFYRMMLLGRHFGFKDDGMNGKETLIGKIWMPLSIMVAFICAIISSKLLA